MKHHARTAVTAVLAAGLLLAACSSSSKSPSSSQTTRGNTGTSAPSGGSPTASAPGLTSTTIKVGLISSLTGVNSSNEADTPQGVEARFNAQNAAGGIDGRKLELVPIDDQSSVAGDLTAAQTLIEQKQVFAVLGYSSFLFGSVKYLQQQGIPVVGSAFDGPEWGMQPYTNMFTFIPPTSTPFNGQFYTYDSAGKFFKQIGVTQLGGFAYGISPSATNAIRATFAASAPYGVSNCYENLSVPYGTTDFTSDALSLKSSACNGAVTAFVDSSDLAMATAVKQSGSNAKILNFTGYDSYTVATAAARAAYQGVYFSNEVLFDKANPGINQMYTNMEKYVPNFNANTLPDYGLFGGYMSADLFITMMKNAGVNPTRQSFINTNRQFTGYTGNGILPSPTNFNNFGTVDMLPQTSCEFYVQLQGSNFVNVEGGTTALCGNRLAYKGVGA
jgi:branched-chain amino acid transport system substrate-binding protein